MLSCETVPKMPQNAFFFTGNNQILKLIFMRNQNFAQLSACRFVEKRNRQIAYELFNGYQNFTRIVRIEKSRASADTRKCVTYCFKRPKKVIVYWLLFYTDLLTCVNYIRILNPVPRLELLHSRFVCFCNLRKRVSGSDRVILLRGSGGATGRSGR